MLKLWAEGSQVKRRHSGKREKHGQRSIVRGNIVHLRNRNKDLCLEKGGQKGGPCNSDSENVIAGLGLQK